MVEEEALTASVGDAATLMVTVFTALLQVPLEPVML